MLALDLYFLAPILLAPTLVYVILYCKIPFETITFVLRSFESNDPWRDYLVEDTFTMKSGQGREADDPEAAAQSTEGTKSTSKAKSRPEELEDTDKGTEYDVNEELHLRGGAGKSSTRYKSTTTRRAPTTRTRGSSGSSQSYVSYGSGGKTMSYVSYGSGQEKYRKPYTARPRYQMMCCAFM